MGLITPLIAIVITFCILGLMLYRRLHLGISLNLAALLLAFLSLDWLRIPVLIRETATNPSTISVVLATFAIMWMSQLYKETNLIKNLNASLKKLVHNSKLLISIPPAIIGLLPVGGGALMSAPLVEAETENLGITPSLKTYLNIWFRHLIMPLNPISQILLLIASLSGFTIFTIILRQFPVVIIMILIGYLLGLRKINPVHTARSVHTNLKSELNKFLISFLPILVTLFVVIGLNIDVALAAFLGVFSVILISPPSFNVIFGPIKRWSIWGITFAAFGAFLLRNVIGATSFFAIISDFFVNNSVNNLILLTVFPTVLAFLTGSALGAVAISYSMIEGVLAFSPQSAALLYISSYLGYLIAPTHLCLVLTADYFKCSLAKLYRYLLPSYAITFLISILTYLFI